jgi:predicted AlkP superfamily phosphohydrolase/phosphomutase
MSKVCVIGLDGATFSVIDYLIGQNRLPNLSRLMSEGCRADLLSTIPPLTPAAWTSFFTGSNPGKTGAVGFFRFRPGTYQLEPMNAGNLQGTPFWLLAGGNGMRTCVYNVPVTYPATPVNGILVSGMDAPSFDERAIYPAEQKGKLLEAVPDFKISNDNDIKYLVNHYKDPTGEWIQQLNAHLDMELRTISYLMQQEDWDLFTAVIRSTDTFQHTFWGDVEKVITGETVSGEERVRAEAVFNCYETIDREFGDSWLEWCSDRDLVIMSDHGFGSLRSDVCINRLLAEAGLLNFQPASSRKRSRDYLVKKLQSHLPVETRQKIKRFLGKEEADKRWHRFVDSLVADIDFSRTRLFAIAQHGCLYVNMKGRDPMGTVSSEAERQAVLDEAVAALSELRDPADGKPVVTGFYRKEELYSGPLIEAMPDMVINMRDWSYRGIYSTTEELSEKAIFRPQNKEWKQLAHTGCHRREGILMLHGSDIVNSRLDAVPMVDVAPTIMNLLGLPALDEWDGRVIEEALSAGAAEPKSAGKTAYETGQKEPGDKVYTQDDEEEIRKRLENLGYI